MSFADTQHKHYKSTDRCNVLKEKNLRNIFISLKLLYIFFIKTFCNIISFVLNLQISNYFKCSSKIPDQCLLKYNKTLFRILHRYCHIY